ncbi:cation:proton antiporter [Spartinivicinus ruber]|uniref:cation:proton antiporter n=1 Tax=Spartinivicinus ruber TaxID=2683272 RepID=UPI0013D4F09F|nr:cation:proton antiporter [Spartinivicinus ruber]
MELGILAILISAIAYAMVARRVSNTVITAPMVFLTVGLMMAYSNLMHVDHVQYLLHLVAEISLIILLFIDAARTNFDALRRQSLWPMRMLLIGLPLTIGLGFLLGIPFFPDWPLPLIALVAAIMAPTDAALGQAVITHPHVPERERLTLTVESGLNDGLALPVILMLACMVTGLSASDADQTNWLLFGLQQITLGPIAGGLLGWVGAQVFLFVESRKLTAPTYEGVAALALAGSSYLIASLIGGNGFIAAFVAGLFFGHFVKGRCRFIYEFTESEGQMLVWASFVFIGLGLLPNAIELLTLPMAIYIMMSLFVVRPLAIYLSLLGTQTQQLTRLFFGWFGPRGLATALFALIVTEELQQEFAHSVLVLSINAVWMSALLHGMTAVPGAEWYARKFAKTKKGLV